jgi:very-short-patch-repair endonuclease
MPKKTTEQFIEKAREVHGNKYDYSKVNYINSHIKVCIICPIHGEFEQTPNNHTSLKHGCFKCSINNKSFTTEQFIQKAKEIHGNKYDYSKSLYKNTDTKLIIICPIHGEFEQTPYKHVRRKQGCPQCAKEKNSKRLVSRNKKKIYKKPTLTTEQFIEKSREVHGNKYDYSKVNYKGNKNKITIICPIHGEFEQIASNHYNIKCGCPYCNSSKGEKEIENFLLEKNINFEREKKFKDCRNKKHLPFDFYLPDYNLLIEYDGEQHYKARGFITEDKLNKIQKHDNIKNEFCKKYKIKLIRISYLDSIKEKLAHL